MKSFFKFLLKYPGYLIGLAVVAFLLYAGKEGYTHSFWLGFIWQLFFLFVGFMITRLAYKLWKKGAE